MNIAISNKDFIINIFNTIKEINIEPLMRFTDENIIIKFLGSGNTVYYTLIINKIYFDTFSIQDSFDIKVNIKYLTEILKKASNEDLININFDDSYSKMILLIVNKNYTKKYEIPLIETTTEDFNLLNSNKENDLEYKNKINITSIEINDIFDSFVFSKKDSGGNVIINCNNNEFKISEKEAIHGNSEFSLFNFDKSGLNENSISKFNYNLLKPLIDCHTKLSESTSIELRNDYPIKITSFDKRYKLITILAPCIIQE